MSLAIVLFENYDGKFQSFPSPTDTIEDYDNIVWTDKDIPSKEELEIKIKEIIEEEKEVIVYNLLSVEPNNNYYANNILVHNKF